MIINKLNLRWYAETREIRPTVILACQQLVSYENNSAYASPPAEATTQPVKQFPSSYIRALFNTIQYWIAGGIIYHYAATDVVRSTVRSPALM